MSETLLRDLLILFGLSIPIVLIFLRLRVPPLVGFLFSGILAGPFGFGLIPSGNEIELLSEIGVALLLFTIGIEFSLKDLMRIWKTVLFGGGLQVSITILSVAFIAEKAGYSSEKAFFFGCLVALSSTAIVLKLLQERGEIYSPHGSTALGILIFQDIAAVGMIILIPLLAGGQGTEKTFFELAFQVLGIVLLTFLSARYVVPFLLYRIARTRNNELFLLSILVIGLSVAWLTSLAGLSLALGAFLAGLIISESEYSTQALGNLLPFRDVFMSIFFISIGMLLDLNLLKQHIFLILVLTVSVMVLKTALNALTTFIIGFPLQTMVLVGLSISQIGEFSLVTAGEGFASGLISEEAYQAFLAVTVISMVLTPFIMGIGAKSVAFANSLPLPKKLKYGWYGQFQEPMPEKSPVNHLLIIGFGINGKNVATAAKASQVPYLILELNPEVIRREKRNGVPVFYGDASQPAVLERAGVRAAKVVAITVGDPLSTRRILEAVRRLNPRTYIIARTNFLHGLDKLYELGANEVISDEFESSIEFFSRVLNRYLVPKTEIETLSLKLRADNYMMLRKPEKLQRKISDLGLDFTDVEISSIRIGDGSRAAEKTLGELALRKEHGVTVLAVSRDNNLIFDLNAESKLYQKDLLLMIGPPENIDKLALFFSAQENPK